MAMAAPGRCVALYFIMCTIPDAMMRMTDVCSMWLCGVVQGTQYSCYASCKHGTCPAAELAHKCRHNQREESGSSQEPHVPPDGFIHGTCPAAELAHKPPLKARGSTWKQPLHKRGQTAFNMAPAQPSSWRTNRHYNQWEALGSSQSHDPVARRLARE
jgi:hypothetical protein